MQSLVKTKSNVHYVVSTRETADVGWETMIFLSSGKETDELADSVIRWSEDYSELYPNEKEATKGHIKMIEEVRKEW